MLQNLPADQLLPVARAFSQFLNLTNIAEQYHTVSRQCDTLECSPDAIDNLLRRVSQGEIDANDAQKAIADLKN